MTQPSAAWAIDISADGSLVAAIAEDAVRIWDADTGEHRQTFTGKYTFNAQCAFSRNGRMLLVYGSQTERTLYDLSSGIAVATFTDSIAVSGDRRVFTMYGPAVDVHSFDTGEHIATVLHTRDGTLLTRAPDGRIDGTMGSAGSGRTIFWQVGTIQLPGFVGLQREQTPGLYAEIIGALSAD